MIAGACLLWKMSRSGWTKRWNGKKMMSKKNGQLVITPLLIVTIRAMTDVNESLRNGRW